MVMEFQIPILLKVNKEYQKVLKEYPKSYRAPFAQYQIGECYEELGEGKLAHKSFKKVLRKYPATRPARWVRWR